MTISETTLRKLVEEYSAPRNEFGGRNYISYRMDWSDILMEEIRPLLSHDRLKSLTNREAEQIYNEIADGGPRLYPKTFIENGLEKIKTALEFLLYGK